MPSHSEMVVTWWSEKQKKWATDRKCRLRVEKGEYVARCDHLTNFALLIEHLNSDPFLCYPTFDRLGFGLSIASAASLMLLCLLYATRLIPRVKTNRFVRIANNSRNQHSDHAVVAYVVVMFSFYLCFILAADRATLSLGREGCSVASVLLYALFLM